MRGFQSGLLAALTCGVLLLAACGGGETSGDAAWTKEDAQKILDSAAFSEELEELDLDTAWMLYGLGDAGLERESLTDGVCRRSAGATCEELTVLMPWTGIWRGRLRPIRITGPPRSPSWRGPGWSSGRIPC